MRVPGGARLSIMDMETKEARIQGMLDGYSVFASIGLNNGSCNYQFRRMPWQGSLSESIVEFGRRSSAQDAFFLKQYGEASYQDAKAMKLASIPPREVTLVRFRALMFNWLCYGLTQTGCSDENFQSEFLTTAQTASEDFEFEVRELCANRTLSVVIPSHPLCRRDVLQDEYIIISGEQLYYVSFGWSD